MNVQPSHWSRHARQWSLIGRPLRPAAKDIRLLEQGLRLGYVRVDWHQAVPDPAALAGDFRIVATHVPTDEPGERCPTLIMPPL